MCVPKVRDTSYMFVTGPEVVKTVTNEDVTQEELVSPELSNGVRVLHPPSLPPSPPYYQPVYVMVPLRIFQSRNVREAQKRTALFQGWHTKHSTTM